MADDEIRYRAPAPGEYATILELLEAAFGDRWPGVPIGVSKLDHLKWKMNSPDTQLDDHIIVEVGGRLAGYATTIVRPAILRGRRLRMLDGGDTCFHPDFQGRGLYRTYITHKDQWGKRRFDFKIGLSDSAQILHTQQSRDSHRFANPIQALLLPLHVFRAAEHQVGKARLRRWPRAAALWLLRTAARVRGRRGGALRPGVSVRQVTRFDARVDSLAETASESFELMVFKEHRYLNWRYGDPRAVNYRISLAERDDEVVGYAITSQSGETIRIVDILVRPSDEGVLSLLLAAVADDARELGAALISCWLPRSHPYRTAMRAEGFIGGQIEHRFHYMPHLLADELRFLERDATARVHVVHGDTDIV